MKLSEDLEKPRERWRLTPNIAFTMEEVNVLIEQKTSSHYGEEVVPMVTWGELFAFLSVLLAIISFVRKDKDDK